MVVQGYGMTYLLEEGCLHDGSLVRQRAREVDEI